LRVRRDDYELGDVVSVAFRVTETAGGCAIRCDEYNGEQDVDEEDGGGDSGGEYITSKTRRVYWRRRGPVEAGR
jgi:hypothetical protein